MLPMLIVFALMVLVTLPRARKAAMAPLWYVVLSLMPNVATVMVLVLANVIELLFLAAV